MPAASQIRRIEPDLPLEEIITAIWSDVLAQPGIDPDNNFFSLGGHSLLAIQCLSRLRERVPLILSLSDFFENPTVTQQAALIRKRLISAEARRSDANRSGCRQTYDAIPPRDRTHAMSAQSSPGTALVPGTIDPRRARL